MAAHQAPCPWDSPGKNTGVGCHFLLQCMKVKSESEVAQSCPTLSDPYLPRNLYAGQETTVRTEHGITYGFQIEKGVHQGCIFSPCLFNLYTEHIMQNAGLDEAQAGIKTAGENSNNLRHADDTTLMVKVKKN